MKASYIYINPQGVPCVPMKQIAETKDWSTQGTKVIFSDGSEAMMHGNPTDILNEVRTSCIPIREEDQMERWRLFTPKDNFSLKPDTFYSVEPYEFEIEEIQTGGRIVKTNGYPTGHEIYYEQVARIIRPEENIITECLSFKQVMDKLYTAYPKHRFILINENAKDPTDKGENEWIKSGHKAEVKSPLLTDEQIEEAAQNACRGIEDEDQLMYALKDFRRGAKMARDHYENRKP